MTSDEVLIARGAYSDAEESACDGMRSGQRRRQAPTTAGTRPLAFGLAQVPMGLRALA